MKRIKDRFEVYKKINPENGDPIIMCMAVRGQHYKRSYIRKWFKILVNPYEYELNELNELLDYLDIQTNEKDPY